MGKGSKDTSRMVLTVRLLIGAYLLYIDYQIFGDVMAREGASRIAMLAIMAAFAIFGITLIIMSLKALISSDGAAKSSGDAKTVGNIERDNNEADNIEEDKIETVEAADENESEEMK